MTDEAIPGTTADADARALSSALRMRILRLCLDEALTNKEIAGRLGMAPATTYHHVRLLAERGFLAAQPERQGNRGAREVPYLSTGKSWRTPMGPGRGRILIQAFLDEFALADPARAEIVRLGVRLNEADRDEMLRRFTELFAEYADRAPDPEGEPLSLFFALHEDVGRRRPD
ncbi:ArsR family transcriptional regulator [Occultella glacieicola]|uniref:ArsR family transcriptional regulator n=1 Tax=Occultella glacieicola TaxID=2518684 RepID=A0ABY2EBF2_9MICO|nr:winged helix-turn-helix domain-containing protein [Occultella glacieicola]TDE97559.1 ArsR family transcriptional regulator [Occultella glacieicola]